jgi:hypothetical protein
VQPARKWRRDLANGQKNIHDVIDEGDEDDRTSQLSSFWPIYEQ